MASFYKYEVFTWANVVFTGSDDDGGFRMGTIAGAPPHPSMTKVICDPLAIQHHEAMRDGKPFANVGDVQDEPAIRSLGQAPVTSKNGNFFSRRSPVAIGGPSAICTINGFEAC